METALAQYLADFAGQYPIGMSLLIGIGVFRVLFKPTMTYLHQVADATPSPKDNELLEKAESSKVYKALAFLADFFLSIKLPQK
jgi:hypothetical protein